jgi:hypothetical protein
MKNFLKIIWEFINSKVFGYIAIGVFIFLLIGTCGRNSKLREDSDRKDQNISALTDSIQIVKLKNGDLQVSKDAYMATAKELEEYNKGLAKEVSDQKGEVISLNHIVFQLKQDTAELRKYIRNFPKPEPPIQINDSTWNINWTLPFIYDSINYDIYKGRTQIGVSGPIDYKFVKITNNGTILLDRESQIGLIWGQKYEKGGKLKVYAQTAHPAFKAKLLEGVYVDYPKKQGWFTGFGVGPTFNVGYDFLHNQPAVIIGAGIHYNIYSW